MANFHAWKCDEDGDVTGYTTVLAALQEDPTVSTEDTFRNSASFAKVLDAVDLHPLSPNDEERTVELDVEHGGYVFRIPGASPVMFTGDIMVVAPGVPDDPDDYAELVVNRHKPLHIIPMEQIVLRDYERSLSS